MVELRHSTQSHARHPRRAVRVAAGLFGRVAIWAAFGVLLTLGVSVLVAWNADYQQPPDAIELATPEKNRTDSILVWRTFGTERIRTAFPSIPTTSQQIGPTMFDWSLSRTTLRRPVYEEGAAGWPLRALTWHFGPQQAKKEKAGGYIAIGSLASLPVEGWTNNRYPIAVKHDVIPYLPWWPGLLVNSAFWAILAFTIHRVFLFVRRARRRRRGRCPRCAYPVIGLGGNACPECGFGVADRRGRAAG